MDSLGEVGVLVNMGADNSGGEILKSLLSTSKPTKAEQLGVNVLPNLHNTNQTEEPLVLQIEVPEPIIQHIPITYLTTETPASNGTFVEPVTYVLSRNVVAENKFVARNEPQKVILVQGVESNPPPSVYTNPEGKVFAVKDRQSGYSKLWEVGGVVEGPNCEVVIKREENGKEKKRESSIGQRKPKDGSNTKVQRKISTNKKPLNKRKNPKVKSKVKGYVKGQVSKVLEEGKRNGEVKEKNLFELTKLEDNVEQVAERLKIGCECSESNCFDGLNPDEVFKHRLNIADLTKAEHDMYLMGVIMASIHNLEETCRHKERIRIRSCYAYQGKKVCLTAFLYLQHVTLYQMKSLRSHLKNHGVSPRIHGNRGRKPANTLSLEIYRRATNFVQNYIENHCVKTVPNFTGFSSQKGNSKANLKMTSYHLPPECTKRRVHKEYKTFCDNLKISQKVMKYSTFTNFLKKQFPNVKFHKREEKKPERAPAKPDEETEKKTRDDHGVDKSIQVEHLTYIPVKTQLCTAGTNTQTTADNRILLCSRAQNTGHDR